MLCYVRRGRVCWGPVGCSLARVREGSTGVKKSNCRGATQSSGRTSREGRAIIVACLDGSATTAVAVGTLLPACRGSDHNACVQYV